MDARLCINRERNKGAWSGREDGHARLYPAIDGALCAATEDDALD